MKKFSRTPWKARGHTVIDADDSVIAESIILNSSSNSWIQECFANAKLMAAAPELLEVAELAYKEVFESDPESKVARNLARAIALAYRGEKL